MTREETTLPNIEFTTANGNFDKLREPITQIIIHSTVGTVQSAISVFGNPAKGTSAHYIVGNDGTLYQGLEEYYTAYHSGNLDVNRRSIGIEHEWYNGITPSNELYNTSAKLVADICKFYGLSVNRGVIKMHKEIVPTQCPNAIDVDRIVREAQQIANPQPTETIESLKKQILDLKETEKRLIKEKDLAIQEAEKKLADKVADMTSDCQFKVLQAKKEIIQKVITYTGTLS